MKNSRPDQLIHILSETTDWVPAKSLSKIMGVSHRTIRNYIKYINNEDTVNIESSKSGYRIKKRFSKQVDNETIVDERTFFILSKLLSSNNGVSIFDISEELEISESTVVNVYIQKIKKLVLPFSLKIQSSNYEYFLKGSEMNKRKMIGYLVTTNNYGYFTSSDILEKIFPRFNTKDLMETLYYIFDNSKLFINNFAMNNLLIHILIILIRIKSNDGLNNDETNEKFDSLNDLNKNIKIRDITTSINNYFKTCFSIEIPDKDYKQIMLLIFLSTNYDTDSLRTVIDDSFIISIEEMVSKVSERYNISKFDQEFISQLTLHMYNAQERCQFNLSYPNPIANQVKKEYAPIYDMAVYFVHLFSRKYHINFSDSEISFITFHFGAYLENKQSYYSPVSCVLIVENYLNISRKIEQQIQNNFKNEIEIRKVMSLNQFMMCEMKCELIISVVDLPTNHPNFIKINPIMTNKNFIDIRNELNYLKEYKKMSSSRIFLERFFDEKLYFRNVILDSPTEYIRFMGEECIKKNFINQSFVEDVLLRESISSTSFTESLAIPHSIDKYAENSFVFVIHNDIPIRWGKNNINFILMIGINQDDMEFFNDAFNLLINFFLVPDNQMKLINTDSFNDFINTLLH